MSIGRRCFGGGHAVGGPARGGLAQGWSVFKSTKDGADLRAEEPGAKQLPQDNLLLVTEGLRGDALIGHPQHFSPEVRLVLGDQDRGTGGRRGGSNPGGMVRWRHARGAVASRPRRGGVTSRDGVCQLGPVRWGLSVGVSQLGSVSWGSARREARGARVVGRGRLGVGARGRATVARRSLPRRPVRPRGGARRRSPPASGPAHLRHRT